MRRATSPTRPRLRAATLLSAVALLALSACGETAPSEPEETMTPTSDPTEPDTTEPTASPTPPPTSTPSELPPTGDPQDDPAGESVTEADAGGSVTVTVGEELPLRLGSAWSWDEPRVEGDAVSLTQVDYLVDPGFVEWLIVGEQPGAATITTTGTPACEDESQCPPMDFDVHVDVE